MSTRLCLPLVLVAVMNPIFAAEGPPRRLVIAASENAPEGVSEIARRLADAAPEHPTLLALAYGAPVETDKTSEELFASGGAQLAYVNLVVVGLVDDPLIDAAWQNEADISGDEIYAFGYGRFVGDLGWIESGPNPWLHSPAVASPPYETHVIVITGTTPEGIEIAVDAFLKYQRVNGLIGDGSERRLESTLLDRDPARADSPPPDGPPTVIEGWTLVGVTDCGEDAYRNVLEATGETPLDVKLLKYFRDGEWDGEGGVAVYGTYLRGLHRLAYGNALLVATFADAEAADKAAVKAADSAPYRATQTEAAKAAAERRDWGLADWTVRIWADGNRLYLRSVPPDAL